ncbi:VOC family protein [Pedosphaera parvula]|uniref:Glyoxalase/bleomycin resistance protein/dioxygenase n=1 Tax=Pedosphaera parvula (strain Ellin514) TaxID=320771 RepID=B9XFC4_PEDPL|nr:VOC family protein [Pedosphaera parvula]EEF61288.1 Glyoxalase/bleomycin resistance protein/dioxygenase [Pedosphaera parvula Ellin514]
MATLALLVLRTATMEATLTFYKALGLHFTEEKHGTGPLHYSSVVGDLVFEIYPGEPGSAPERKTGGATMLGFTVDQLDATLALLNAIKPDSQLVPKESPWGRRAVAVDPDGRAVEITERSVKGSSTGDK